MQGKVRDVGMLSVCAHRSVHFGVAAIRDNTADTTSIAFYFYGCICLGSTSRHCRRLPAVLKSSAITVKSGPVRVADPAA